MKIDLSQPEPTIDAGTHRLTFWHNGTKVRFTCDAEGNVTKTVRVNTGKRP